MNEQIYQNNNTAILFETIGINKVFKNKEHMVTAVSDISIKININDFVIIFGSLGSGKSTLLSILFGLEKPDIGEVLVKGEPFYEFSDSERAYLRLTRFGLVPRRIHWLENMSLLRNTALPLVVLGESFKKAEKVACEKLNLFGITKNLNKKPESFSAYEQKLASLVRAMIGERWAIFLDEPCSELNSEDTKKFMEIISKIHEEQKVTVVLATNEPQYFKYASKLFFINDGLLEDFEKDKNPLAKIKESIAMVEEKEKQNKKKNENINII